MEQLLNIEQIKQLKLDEPMIECLSGKVNYYRFLCFHPRNPNYVILLNNCENPERFYYQSILDRFYINYSTKDIICYKKNYFLKEIEELDNLLLKAE